MPRKAELQPRREDPGLSWCRQCHGTVIPSATGAMLTPMGELHSCTETRKHLAAIGAAWIEQEDGSVQWTWPEPTQPAQAA